VPRTNSEETTKGLVSDKLKNIDEYPTTQNLTVNKVTWFKEDSYKNTNYSKLCEIFKKASKNQKLNSRGTPDFTITLDSSEIIVLVECKSDVRNHSQFVNYEDYITHGYGTSIETNRYAINGALWYASFLKDYYDVIAIGVSGQNNVEAKVTSFVWPKGKEITDIKLVENGNLNNSLISIEQYKKDIDIILERFAPTEELIRKELRKYTLSCANFLRANGIEDNSKAGFVSAIILGLTNRDSKLYKDTKNAIDSKRIKKAGVMDTDPLGSLSVKILKASLYGDGDPITEAESYIKGVWDIDGIPMGKRTALQKFYDVLLTKNELLNAPKGKNKYFQDGKTVLSCCIFSLYEYVIEVLEKYTGIDVMGEFYTTFLRFTKGNAKEKGIVLTPKHITEFFCDIAEYYLDKRFDENTKVIDICCGTGAFLIATLNKIRANISTLSISEIAKNEKYSLAQKNSLIGVEKDASMYTLAYANMRFHGDGKSNLFNCSSLLIDSYAPIDDSGKTYISKQSDLLTKIPLHEALKEFNDIDVGMINPPYSLNKKDNSSNQEYQLIKDIEALKDEIKKKKMMKKNKKINEEEEKINKINEDIDLLNKKIQNKELEIKSQNLQEVVFQKGQDELDFVASMLHYLKKGGIGIAIVPMSCAGNSGAKLRSELLKHHTLLACMTMPLQLFFDSHIDIATCIMVFKAHIPHDNSKATFFGRWIDDGFKIIPHNGRKDTGEWKKIKQKWIDQIDGTAEANPYIWLKKKINIDDEALAEAYIKTDYSKLSDVDFEKILKKYSLFKYMDKNGLIEE